MSRHDGASADYRYSEIFSKLLFWVFWVNIPICIFPLFFHECAVVSAIQIVLPILYLLVAFLDDHFFWYSAEQKRRELWLSDGYKCSFCPETTDGYYNNETQGSLLRLAVNSFESAYFTERIAKKMFVCSSIKGLFAFIAFIVICISHLDYAIISLVAQTIFSGSILADFAKQIIFYWRVKNVHERFYRQFVTEGVVRSEQIHSLFENMIEYECLKSFYQVRLSQKIFYKWFKKW